MRAAEDVLTNLPPALPPLEFFKDRVPLPDLLLKDKREGHYITGFPAIGYDPETGFGIGAITEFYDNGEKDSPFFRYTPYRRRIGLGVNVTTGGFRRVFVGYDHPYIGDTPWRVRGAALLTESSFENYFGIGEQTLDNLSFPGSTKSFSDFEDYQDALEHEVNGQTYARYNDYRRTEGRALLTVERNYLGGRLRPLLGLQFAHVGVDDYTGDHVDGAVMQTTRLREDYLAGRINGFHGGWDNALKVGLTFDTRDFEPDPSEGVMLQMVGRISTHALASEFDYQQFTFTARAFHNLLGGSRRLILAGRFTYVMQFGDVPFYSASVIPFTDGDKIGLGGYETLRGFKEARFVGDAAALANAELRWSFAETKLGQQHLRFMLVPFVDTGRVFDAIARTTLQDWKVDAGLGFRLAWNLSTIVSFDYSVSGETKLFNMELGHQF